eukprot:2001425-Rhodomonas_salina.1
MVGGGGSLYEGASVRGEGSLRAERFPMPVRAYVSTGLPVANALCQYQTPRTKRLCQCRAPRTKCV